MLKRVFAALALVVGGLILWRVSGAIAFLQARGESLNTLFLDPVFLLPVFAGLLAFIGGAMGVYARPFGFVLMALSGLIIGLFGGIMISMGTPAAMWWDEVAMAMTLAVSAIGFVSLNPYAGRMFSTGEKPGK
jgi:hypothetical protein